ncbi:hypothetical protein KP509_1Z104600 [Ceratopteris richardii]|nr:hypothetical protein KP509_1Z104600 [Ceratopteris richardii]
MNLLVLVRVPTMLLSNVSLLVPSPSPLIYIKFYWSNLSYRMHVIFNHYFLPFLPKTLNYLRPRSHSVTRL